MQLFKSLKLFKLIRLISRKEKGKELKSFGVIFQKLFCFKEYPNINAGHCISLYVRLYSRAYKNDTGRFYHFPREDENLMKLKDKLNQEEIIDRFSARKKVLKMDKRVYIIVCEGMLITLYKRKFYPTKNVLSQS